MRVSRIIDQYVRDEVRKKYQPLIDAIEEPMCKKKAELDDILEGVFKNYYEEVNKTAVALGFEPMQPYDKERSHWYRQFSSGNFHVVGHEEIEKKRRAIYDKMSSTIHDILLSLELGSAQKSELNDILATVTVEDVN